MKISITDKGARIELSDADQAQIARLAQEQAMKPGDLMREVMREAMDVLLENDNELSPKAAGVLLGVSKYTMLRYIKDGKFPGAYQLNDRNYRIPRPEVDALKEARRLRVA